MEIHGDVGELRLNQIHLHKKKWSGICLLYISRFMFLFMNSLKLNFNVDFSKHIAFIMKRMPNLMVCRNLNALRFNYNTLKYKTGNFFSLWYYMSSCIKFRWSRVISLTLWIPNVFLNFHNNQFLKSWSSLQTNY